MNEKSYKKKLDFQQKMISRQSNQISSLKAHIEKLEKQIQEKDELINSVEFLRCELINNVNEIKQKKNEYQTLIEELKKMKNILNKEVYKGRWKLIRLLIK